ncbi:MAG: L,D-transpeptidase [Candidatus Dormibacteria bacterium]
MSSEAQISTAATPLGSCTPHGKSWLRRPRWIAALALLALVIGVGATIGIHAAQGVGNRQRAQLAAARELASKVVGEARTAGINAGSLELSLRQSQLPGWTSTALSLLEGGGNLPAEMTREAQQLRSRIAQLETGLRPWTEGMTSIDQVRTETRAQLLAAVKALPNLKAAVDQRTAKLSLSGAVPLARQETTLATLTSADVWAGQLALAAKAAAAKIATDKALVAQSAQLKIPPGNASQEIQQAQSKLPTASSSSAVQSVMSNLSSELLTLEVDVRAAAPGTGQVIVVHLAAQTLTAYDNGTQVLETPVTTGRKGLRTPLGIDTITWEASPYLFISPWPEGNPYYYPPSEVNWVLHFHSGGYFIHNSPWEPNSVYGPGSENGPDASHGCVQVPYNAMKFLWNWTKIGATVVVAP